MCFQEEFYGREVILADRDMVEQQSGSFFYTAADLLTRIINTGWRHCAVYYRCYIDFICNIPLVLKFLFLDLE